MLTNLSSYVTNLHIVKVHPDKNGYFLVDTEFDNVLLSLQNLMKLKREIEKNKEDIAKEVAVNFDVYEEAFYKECN